MFVKKIVAITIAILAMTSIVMAHVPEKGNPTQRKTVSSATRRKEIYIARRVMIYQRRSGPVYAHRVAALIVAAAAKAHLDPLVVATTAEIENDYGRVNPMQFESRTWWAHYGKFGLNSHSMRDNIYCGADYLAMHLYARRKSSAASRGGLVRGKRSRGYRNMWLRYNGSYRKHAYAAEAEKLLSKMRRESR